jgi:DNA mismatch repair protein MutS
MAGKSTYLRQVALIVLLAQIGSFVPADEAQIGLADRIFCRVGASDNLARGESTFLVEMNEAAYILRNASPSSLVIVDEIGRGTSTNDGLAIAQAVTEDLVNRVRCRTLFATHFHELTALALPEIANWSLKVVDDGGSIVFLKRLEPGPSSNSYGIHVAEVAGLPKEVVARGAEILRELVRAKESPDGSVSGDRPAALPNQSPAPAAREAELFAAEELVAHEIRSMNTDELRPIDALKTIYRWKRELDGS